jgi:hypothetical protein
LFILILAFYAIYNTRFSWTFFDVQHFWFDGKVDLKNLNIFIGPNGSGKSNLISYLKFLNECFIGSSDSSRQVSAVDLAFSELNRILDINLPIPAQVRLVYGLSNKEDYLSGLVLDSSLYITHSFGSKAIINKDFLYKGLDLEENLDNPYFYYKYL